MTVLGYNNATADAVECEDDQFTCLDGLCIPTSQVCDRLRDCSDGSDEAGEECDIDIGKSIPHCYSDKQVKIQLPASPLSATYYIM